MFRHFIGRRLFRRTPDDSPQGAGGQQQGNEFLARGELADAIRCYRAAADADPVDAAARLSLGFALLEQQSIDEARHWLQEVLRLQPGQHEAHFFLARAARMQGALESAAAGYAEAARHAPAFELARQEGAEACIALGQRELAAERREAALRWFEDAVARCPGSAPAQAHLGLALETLGRPEAAAESYGRALALQPSEPQALFGLGNVCMQRNDPAAAATHYAQVLGVLPDHLPAQANLAQALAATGRHEEAARRFRQVLQQHPGDAGALLGEANALLTLRRHKEALAAYDGAIAVSPQSPLAHLNRGNTLLALRRPEEALQGFRRALQLHPGYVEALVNIGSVLFADNRFAEALQAFEEALAQDPANAAAHWNLGLCLLLQGRLERGWTEAEWRWQALGRERLRTGRPQWSGAEPVAGRRILVHHEQGLGDTVQFCRYVPLLAERGATVLLAVQPALAGLVETLPGPFQLVPAGEPLPEHDYECPLMSLPLAFGTRIDSIPAPLCYLASRPAGVRVWRERLGASGARRVGIAWSGNASHVNDHNRSLPLAKLLPIADAGVQLVSLQKEVRESDAAVLRGAPVQDFSCHLGDFEGTAALIECMDLVVTVDTSIAHVAGALGKAVWVLLPFSSDWRWLLDRTDSPWYPSARLFRQPRPGDWDSVVAAVRAALESEA